MFKLKKEPLTGKTYAQYRKEDDARNWKSAERLRLAKEARRERIRKGIDITLPKLNINPNVQREAKPSYFPL